MNTLTRNVLGYSGLIPFFVLTLLLLLSQGAYNSIYLTAFCGYSAIIISFIAGSFWGQVVHLDAVNKAVLLILSNVISLLAWAGFLLVSSNFLITGFLFLLALFISLYWIEKHLLLPFISTSKHKATPSYLRLRRQLTLMVCSCHVFILIHLLNMRFSV
jgi:hypothetical protein